MRYSSMKSIVTALTISVTLLAAAPAVAAPAQKARQQQSTARETRDTDRIGAVRQFINRTIRRISTQTGIVLPIPKVVDPEENQ